MPTKPRLFACPSCGRTRVTQVRGTLCLACYERQRPRERHSWATCQHCGRTRWSYYRRGLCSACYEQGRRCTLCCTVCGAVVEAPASFAAMQLCPRCYTRSRITTFACASCGQTVTAIPTNGCCPRCHRAARKVRVATCQSCGQTRKTEYNVHDICKACQTVAEKQHKGLLRTKPPVSAEEREAECLSRLAPLRRVWVREFLETAYQDRARKTRREFLLALVNLDQYLCSQAETGGGQWTLVTEELLQRYLGTGNRFRLDRVRAFLSWLETRKRCRELATVLPQRPRLLKLRVLQVEQILTCYRQWTKADAEPRQALVGLLALVHGLSSGEIRGLQLVDVLARDQLRVGGRVLHLTAPVALALARYQAWRTLMYGGPSTYLLVSQASRLSDRPVSATWLHHDLLPGTPVASLRQSAIQQLIQCLGCDGLQLAAYTCRSLQAVQQYLRVFQPQWFRGVSEHS